MPLARLSGEVALEQVRNGRHFLVEQPQGSGLYAEPQWKILAPLMFTLVFDQCMTGLRTNKHPWWPVRKTTEIKASHPSLLTYLQNPKCDGSHPYAHIGSWSEPGRPTVRSVEMQVWPNELCERIAAGVAECVMQMLTLTNITNMMTLSSTNGMMTTTNETKSSYPSVRVGTSDGVPAPEAEPEARTYSCPACRSHLRKTDPKHTHDENCKFPNVESTSWTCPGCVARKNRAHESHPNDETCQWSFA